MSYRSLQRQVRSAEQLTANTVPLCIIRYGEDPWKMKLRVDGGDKELLAEIQKQHLVFAGPSMGKEKSQAMAKFEEIE